MTEKAATYGTQSQLDYFADSPCAMPFSSENYRAPTPEEVGKLIKAAGWSQRQVAQLTGVNYNEKGSTTVRKWKTTTGTEQRKIPYSAWRLMLLAAGVATIPEDRAAL